MPAKLPIVDRGGITTPGDEVRLKRSGMSLMEGDKKPGAPAERQPPMPVAQIKAHVLETITRYSHEQGLTPRVIGLDEIFAPSTLEL